MRLGVNFAILVAALSAALVLVACALPGPTPDAQLPAATEVNAAAAGNPGPAGEELLPVEAPPFDTSDWRTDFTRRTVPWTDIRSGGPPKDGIPAIDSPEVETVAAAGEWLSAQDPVILFQQDGSVRAYPLAILIWHEIVNDEVGGKPVAVTFCPLCNASIVFDRDFDGQVLDFGTTGRLRNSDLVMYDRQTETWWQQFTGQGLVGAHAGRQLAFLPSQVISFGDFAAQFPDGQVLARPTSVSRNYGANPYVGYDSTDQPFLFDGESDSRLPATERIVGLALGEEVMAYAFSTLAEAGAVNDEVGGVPVAIFHKAGTASALDSRTISEGRDVGSAAVFDRRVGDQVLTFAPDDGTFRDQETGSTWNLLGEAIAGELAGQRLAQQLAFDHFWFAWSAFHPDTGLFTAPAGERVDP